jgi:hypothetical protein
VHLALVNFIGDNLRLMHDRAVIAVKHNHLHIATRYPLPAKVRQGSRVAQLFFPAAIRMTARTEHGRMYLEKCEIRRFQSMLIQAGGVSIIWTTGTPRPLFDRKRATERVPYEKNWAIRLMPIQGFGDAARKIS